MSKLCNISIQIKNNIEKDKTSNYYNKYKSHKIRQNHFRFKKKIYLKKLLTYVIF